MRPSEGLAANRERIRDVLDSHGVRNPRVFGSVARESDTDSSDLDLLVDPSEQTTLFDIGAIRSDLLSIMGTDVDVVTPNALPPSYRQRVLDEAIPL